MPTPIRHAAVALLLAVFALPAAAQELPPPSLTVTGEGHVSAAPDIAVITLAVVAEAKTAQDALASNAKDMTAVIAEVKAAGIGDRDIATSGLSVEPVYSDPEKSPDGRATITGYRVSNQITVRVRELSVSGALLDAVVKAGANRVAGIAFEIDGIEALRDQAIEAAILEAKRKADLMAKAAGVTLGPIRSLNTSDAGMPFYRMEARAMSAAAPQTPIMGGEQTVTVSATVVYDIGPQQP